VELFTSFDQAWDHFLARTEPLESFFYQFPEEDTEGEGWLIVPPPEVKREVLRLQGELEDVPGLELIPHHFLHVWLGRQHGPDVEELAGGGPFELAYRKASCFHTAVFVEAHAERLDEVDSPDTYLPHLTIAVARGAPDVQPVRDAVVPLRDGDLGTTLVDELVYARFPMSRSTVLQPWTVIERLPLRG
jgi:2'-5' RNA ligase